MSANNTSREANHAEVFTVISGGNTNYGFHPSHPQAPPPKYEDIINGVSQDRRQYSTRPAHVAINTQDMEPANVIFVAPAYKQTNTQKVLGLIFMFVFLAAFISILIKILGSR